MRALLFIPAVLAALSACRAEPAADPAPEPAVDRAVSEETAEQWRRHVQEAEETTRAPVAAGVPSRCVGDSHSWYLLTVGRGKAPDVLALGGPWSKAPACTVEDAEVVLDLGDESVARGQDLYDEVWPAD